MTKDCIPRFRNTNNDLKECFTFDISECDWWQQASDYEKIEHAKKKALENLKNVRSERKKMLDEIMKCQKITYKIIWFLDSRTDIPKKYRDFAAFMKNILLDWLTTLNVCEKSATNRIIELEEFFGYDDKKMINEYTELLETRKETSEYVSYSVNKREKEEAEWLKDILGLLK